MLSGMDVFRTPDDRFEGLPGYDFEPQYTEVDGLRLHHVEEGGGRPIVCFHGEPTWAYLYRKMLGPLVEGGYRVICPDYAGFGRSDKPTDRGWYTYDRHLELVGAQLEGLDLSDAVVVVQDWGGPIGLRWAVENADRVGALAILNTGIFTGRVSKGFMAWRDFAEKNPDLPVGFVIQGATTSELPDDVVAAYDAPFPTAESKAGAAQFPLLVPTEEDAPGAPEMREVAEALGRWDKPALIAFSDGDPVFPFPRAGERFVGGNAGELQIGREGDEERVVDGSAVLHCERESGVQVRQRRGHGNREAAQLVVGVPGVVGRQDGAVMLRSNDVRNFD
jgi:haloalkane dehalogenase